MEGRRVCSSLVFGAVAGLAGLLAGPAMAQPSGMRAGGAASGVPFEAQSSRLAEQVVDLDGLFYMHVSTGGEWLLEEISPPGPQYRGCTNVSSHTDADFEGGSFVLQAGFAQGEVAAASYTLTADQFPVRVDLMEMIFATSQATESTTTEWSILVWDGPPNTGILVAEYSSDGDILPHIELPPGTNGINVQVSVDPNDPNQIIINNESGTNTISFGYRIDKHNFQVQDPCLVPPPANRNCFPTTDVSGLQSSSGNWLKGVNCGPLGCPANGGWARFSGLNQFCRPSGDWVMRMTWTSLNCQGGAGACCMPDGSCVQSTSGDCVASGGVYQGDGTSCGTVQCQELPQACCFESTGGCVNLTPTNCMAAGGVPGGVGTSCATYTCFATGAACLPNGTCVDDVTEDEALAMGGTYMGDGTTCADTVCPDPVGAACFSNGFCLVLTEAEALAAGASWAGPGTTCADVNGNGDPDACEPDCPSDVNGDGLIDTRDVVAFLNYWATSNDEADFDDNGVIDTRDVIGFLGAWAGGC
ncbi:MAG: hypothetical protein IT431_04510 [Phycisphaerales bacterium]|nr:hypothetical protein [Phycisphaerales bacterium]